MHNVSLLKTEDGLTWLGGFSHMNHYDALVQWACDVAKGNDVKLSEILQERLFVRLQDVVIKEQKYRVVPNNNLYHAWVQK